MSHTPWAVVIMRQAERQTILNLRPIAEELYEDLDSLPAPRDTGRLLSGLSAVRLRGTTLHAGIFRPPQAIYGAYLNEGTGIYGPTGKPIVPTQAKVLSWVSAASGRVFAASVKGTDKHIGWWDRWVRNRAPLAVRRGWSN
jgi:hypothetical protein